MSPVWVVFIAVEAVGIIIGLIGVFAPKLFLKPEQREDPKAAAQMKKAGGAILAFMVFAGLYIYNRRRFF